MKQPIVASILASLPTDLASALQRFAAAPTPTEMSVVLSRVIAQPSTWDAPTATTKIPRVIVESPYKGLPNAVKYAEACCWDCIVRGEAPLASHLIYTRFLDDTDLGQRKLGMMLGWAWLLVCDYVAVYEDFGTSPGMGEAIEIARAIGKDVRYRNLGKDEDIRYDEG